MEIHVPYKDLHFPEHFEEILFLLVQKVDLGVPDVHTLGQLFIYLLHILFHVSPDVFAKILPSKDLQHSSCNVQNTILLLMESCCEYRVVPCSARLITMSKEHGNYFTENIVDMNKI